MKEKPAIPTDIVRLFRGNYISWEREIRGRGSLYCGVVGSDVR